MRQEKQHMLRCCRAFLQPALVPQSEASEGVIFSCCTINPCMPPMPMREVWGGFLLQPMRFLEELPTRPLTGWLGLGRASERASDGASERGGAMRTSMR